MKEQLLKIKSQLVDAIKILDSMIEQDELPGQISMDEIVKEKEVNIEDVRKILANKSRAGYTEQIRELLQKYGAKKLSDINSSKYKDLMEEAEKLI